MRLEYLNTEQLKKKKKRVKANLLMSLDETDLFTFFRVVYPAS